MPLAGEIVAYRFVVGTHRGQLDSRIGEVQVGMLQFAKHRTLDGFAEHTRFAALRQQYFGKTDGQCQLPRTLWSGQHDSMWQTVFIHHPH